MKNPFSFTTVVDDPAFCDRDNEQRELIRLIESSQNVLLYSHRRFGKTSLILKVFKQLADITPIYIDLYGSTSVQDFIRAALAGISTAEPRPQRLMKLVRETISGFTASFTLDPVTGLPTISPQLTADMREPPLADVFRLARAVATKKRMVIAFDEFQEVARYGKDRFEKQLRGHIQQHRNIAYVFSGSQKHLIVEMFNDAKRAFYRQAASFPLKKIPAEAYVAWVQSLYRLDGRTIDAAMVARVIERCERHPAYIQEFFNRLWDEKKISMETIDHIERRIIRARMAEYAYAWDSLTLNQRRAMKLITATGGRSIYAAGNLAAFGFKTPSQATTAIEKLVEREFIVKNGTYQVQDPIFKRWLEMAQSVT